MTKSSSQVENQDPSRVFIAMGLDMSWRLAGAVLVPILVGVGLDNWLDTKPWLLIIGFGLAIVGAILVIKQSVRLANNHPVLNKSKETDAK